MTTSITPERLRAWASSLRITSHLHEDNRPKLIADLDAAADEIERLQSDVTELMSACNKALNAK